MKTQELRQRWGSRGKATQRPQSQRGEANGSPPERHGSVGEPKGKLPKDVEAPEGQKRPRRVRKTTVGQARGVKAGA